MKIDVVKTVSIVGTVLGVGATLLSNWATKKDMNDTIKEEVAKALKNK